MDSSSFEGTHPIYSLSFILRFCLVLFLFLGYVTNYVNLRVRLASIDYQMGLINSSKEFFMMGHNF